MKKQTKITIAACAAAVLAAGGFGVYRYIDNLGKLTPPEPPPVEEVSGEGEVTPPAETVPTLGLNLTDQYDEPAVHGTRWGGSMGGYVANWEPLTATATGWYFWEASDCGSGYCVYYSDAATGETVPLCPKPQCLHDGSLYCTATTMAYRTLHVVSVDGRLFAAAQKDPDPETPNNVNERDPAYSGVLLEYAPDGTSITELVRYGRDTLPTGGMIAHRGYLWYIAERTTRSDVLQKDEETGKTSSVNNHGFAILGYEIATGKSITLAEYYPESSTGRYYNIPGALWGDGDYLYFVYGDEYFSWDRIKALGGTGTFRISLLTGAVERVSKYCAECYADGKILYTDISDNDLNLKSYFLLDLATGEKQELFPYTGKYDRSYCYAPVFDGQHVFALNFDGKDQQYVKVFDLDGTEAAMVAVPDNLDIRYGQILDGRLFYRITGKYGPDGQLLGTWYIEDGKFHAPDVNRYIPQAFYSIAVSDLLNSTPNWQRTIFISETPAY